MARGACNGHLKRAYSFCFDEDVGGIGMRFGKISAGLLCAAGAVIVFLIAYNVICKPG